ncbi:hypothetical protein [Arthrobacter sp. CAN_C5]|uniref:hypothetical protein n=1 Tax=Arthrobacter sp. CAN_C5 TaxID=2760706 RepID=UPI001AE6572D|nr:hypothetical protein [Arthrobacter sp. CAN_C5]MBP2216010.1 hypothetical protein [Arthrobacter sp. CAN_C5]
MNNRSTSTAVALACVLGLGLTSCAAAERRADIQTSATSAVAAASPSAEATAEPTTPVPPARPEAVPLDMSGVAMDPAVPEMYLSFEDPNLLAGKLGDVAEEFTEVGLSFTDQQKASHTRTVADLEEFEPLRPLVDPVYWDNLVENWPKPDEARETMMGLLPLGPTSIFGEEEYAIDDNGYSVVFKNEGMKIVHSPWENEDGSWLGEGVEIQNVKARIFFTAVDGEVMHVDRELTIHLWLDGNYEWKVHTATGPDATEWGASTTQEELDELPPL